jgi:hypothetical protein
MARSVSAGTPRVFLELGEDRLCISLPATAAFDPKPTFARQPNRLQSDRITCRSFPNVSLPDAKGRRVSENLVLIKKMTGDDSRNTG